MFPVSITLYLFEGEHGDDNGSYNAKLTPEDKRILRIYLSMYLYARGDHGDEDGSDNGQLTPEDERILRIYLSIYVSLC